jgi:hypothetical protein
MAGLLLGLATDRCFINDLEFRKIKMGINICMGS